MEGKEKLLAENLSYLSIVESEFRAIQEKLPEIKEAGGRAFLVGGAVRDILFEKRPVDFDFLITGVSVRDFVSIFPNSKKIEDSLNVYMVYSDLSGFVEVQLSSTLDEGISGRDFSINSIACELVENYYTDDFDIIDRNEGLSDIECKNLVALDGAIKDDPIRIYRGFRFVVKYNLSISQDTAMKFQESVELLESVKPERVFEEIKKVFLLEKPSDFFRYLLANNMLHYHFAEISVLAGVPQVEKYHPEGDVFEHTMLALDRFIELIDEDLIEGEKRCMLAYSILMHDIGKGVTLEEEYPHHYKHDKFGLDAFDMLIEREGYILPNSWIKATKFFIKNHMKINYVFRMNPGKLVRLLERIKRSPFNCIDYTLGVVSDKAGRGETDAFDEECFNGKIMLLGRLYTKMYEETSGSDIDHERYSGEEIGEQLFQLRCRYVKRERNKFFDEYSEVFGRCV